MPQSSRVLVGRGVEQQGACHDVWCCFALPGGRARTVVTRGGLRAVLEAILGSVGPFGSLPESIQC